MEHKLTIGTRDSKMNEDLDLVRLNRGPERVTGKITNANYISGITFTYPDLPGANVWHAPMEEWMHCRYNNLPVYFHEESNIYCVIDNDVVFEMQSFHRQKTRSANPSCRGCAKYGSNPKTSYKLVPGDVIACSIGCCEERRMCMDCKAPTKWGWKLDKTNVCIGTCKLCLILYPDPWCDAYDQYGPKKEMLWAHVIPESSMEIELTPIVSRPQTTSQEMVETDR